ncbi:hypothetical protein ACPPVO_41480 [Dactylosporangium sp. McL0621]|uniref:hypothetical protein n=1 Tax=Dactylosporangium sp. McL0621 TaxID=3415678 RepID=UPI003CFADECC
MKVQPLQPLDHAAATQPLPSPAEIEAARAAQPLPSTAEIAAALRATVPRAPQAVVVPLVVVPQQAVAAPRAGAVSAAPVEIAAAVGGAVGPVADVPAAVSMGFVMRQVTAADLGASPVNLILARLDADVEATQPLPSPAEVTAAAAERTAARDAAQLADREAVPAVAARDAVIQGETEADAGLVARRAIAAHFGALTDEEVLAELGADVDDATQPLPPPPPREHPVHRPPTAMIATLAAGVLVVGAVAVVLVGRIDRPPSVAEDVAPQTFSSPRALVDYLDRRGLPCSGYEAVEAPAGVVKAGERGRCTAGGRQVGVGVYAGHAEIEAQWAAEAGRGPLFMALGENWTVDGPADWTKRVAGVMGVQYRAQP